MSERKVLNKYYPPDFDPSAIPRLKRAKNSTFEIRLMAPFNMRCNTCGEYIYKGKKFNSRKETVENDNYLGLHIYRFYIKCPMCIAEISFKTDPKNTDYEIEAGATRNFEALRTAEKMAVLEEESKKAEENSNPMKLLENRTKASKKEMDEVEALEDLKELRKRQERITHEDLLVANQRKCIAIQEELNAEEKELEEHIKYNFGNVKRLAKDEDSAPPSKILKLSKDFDRIKASIKPKNKVEVIEVKKSTPPTTSVVTPPTTSVVVTPTASKETSEETPKIPSFKLIDYDDSDEE